MIDLRRFSRHLAAGVLSLFGLLALAPAQAIDEKDLLDVDTAFVLSAEAANADQIAIRWKIADGYYLYKHRISVTPDAGFAAKALQLPKGEAHDDEFFGKVETYRQTLTATLPGQAKAERVTLKIKYQGCADAGICYPPQTRSVSVALVGGASAPTVAAEAAPTIMGSGLFGSNAPAASTDALPLPPEQAFGFEAIAADGNTLLLRFTPARGYYLYRDRNAFKLDANAAKAGIALGKPQWPRGQSHRDEHFGEVTVYFDQVDVPLPLARTRADAATVALTATFQGCQNDGICYPPMTRVVQVALPAGVVGVAKVQPIPTPALPLKGREQDVAADTPPLTDSNAQSAVAVKPSPSRGGLGGDGFSADASASNAPANEAEDSRIANSLASEEWWIGLLIFFAAGLGAAFSACMYPMIPILSGLIAGHGPSLGVRKAFWLSLIYVLASALVLAIVGVIAGLLTINLQTAFQKPGFIIAFAALFVAMALSMFGLYELQLPAKWRSAVGGLVDQQRGGSWKGVALMGALSTLIVGPCATPYLAGLTAYIAKFGNPLFGGIAFFVFGLGMGTPLLAFGAATGAGMPSSGPWMVAVQRVFGFVFLGLAVWMLSRILPGPVTLALWAALLLGAAVMIALAASKPGHREGLRALGWVIALLLGITGVAQAIGALAGSSDPLQPLAGLRSGGAAHRELPFRVIKSDADLDREIAAAHAAGKPLLLDFYADWCVSCKEMEKYTFPDPGVQAALQDFVLLKADVTANDEVDQALMKRLGIIGPPATLYYVDGSERRELRLFGYEKAAAFVARAQRVQAR